MRVVASRLVLLMLLARPLAAQGPELSVHSIFGTRGFASDLVDLQWMGDGAYTVLDDSAGQTNLYRVDAVSGNRTVLLQGEDLVPSGARDPIDVEGYQFSKDGTKLVIFTNSARVWRQRTKGTFFVWDFTARKLLPVSTKPGYQMFAKLSPDGRLIAFARDNNIFVTDLTTGVETALTTDGGENIINGTTDWVYEEELDLRDAFRWSPDGKRIAYWRFDQTAVRPFYLIDADSLYPSAGTGAVPQSRHAQLEGADRCRRAGDQPHDVGRSRRQRRHLGGGDGLRGLARRDLAHPAQPQSEPTRAAARRRPDRHIARDHDRERFRMGGIRAPPDLGRRRQAVPL